MSRIASAVVAIGIVVLGGWIAFLGQYYYVSTLRFDYGTVPVWKSAIIIPLIGACVIAPVYAAYKLLRFAFRRA